MIDPIEEEAFSDASIIFNSCNEATLPSTGLSHPSNIWTDNRSIIYIIVEILNDNISRENERQSAESYNTTKILIIMKILIDSIYILLLSANLHHNKCNILHFLSGPIHSTLYFFFVYYQDHS